MMYYYSSMRDKQPVVLTFRRPIRQYQSTTVTQSHLIYMYKHTGGTVVRYEKCLPTWYCDMLQKTHPQYHICHC